MINTGLIREYNQKIMDERCGHRKQFPGRVLRFTARLLICRPPFAFIHPKAIAKGRKA